MASFTDTLTDAQQKWIAKQHIFFVATAPLSSTGHVNLSPKGHDALRILDEKTVAYLDMTGSGNETSAHIAENNRVTFMWCAFKGSPDIVRAYGRGEVVLKGSQRWDELIGHFEPLPGARQIIINHVESVQSSCGYAVPFFDYAGERETLKKWATHKGEDGLQAYQSQKNKASIDGLPTPIAKQFE